MSGGFEQAYQDEARADAVDPSDGEDRYCHSLDEAGRALCFADIRGRSVHTRFVLDSAAGTFNLAFCPGCGRQTCPRCNEIALALGRSA